ncbi:MAG: mechanosensitive ion channel domain-containing protein [Desulfohalobiaceae bacterium]
MSHWFRHWPCFLLLIILVCPVLFASKGLLAQEELAQKSELKDLETILQAEAETFKQQMQVIEAAEEKLPDMMQSFQSKEQKLLPKLNRLMRLKAFVGANFKELVFLRQFLERLRQEHAQSMAPLQQELERLDKARSRLQELKQELLERIQMDSHFAVGQDQEQRLEAYNSLLQKNDQLQFRIQSILDSARNTSQRISSLHSSLQQELDQVWRSHFFSQETSIKDLSLQRLLQDFQEWRQGLPVYFNFFFIGQMPWLKYLGYGLGLAIALSVLALAVMKKLRANLPQPGPAGPFILPLLLICCSLSLWAMAVFLPNAFPSVLLLTIIQILLLQGLSLLLWRFRLFGKSGGYSGLNPLIPLWWLFAASLILQSLNLPSSLLILIWPAVLVLCVLWLLRSYPNAQLRLERSILIFALAALLLLTLAALTGWVNLSLLLGSFIFVLGLSLQLGAVTAELLKARVALLPDSNLGYLGQGLIQGTGVPLLWILSLLLAVIWLSVNMGDVQFLQEITRLNLGWGAISVNMFRLILVLIGFYLARSSLVILRSIMDSMAEDKEHLDPGTTATLKTLITYVVWAVYLVLALAFLGLNLTSLTVVAGGLSVGIGFGMQSIVNNFISGLILLFGRAIKPGDIIQVEDLWAEVQEVNIRSTVVETFDKSTILLPNSMLIEKQITNWTLADKTIRRTITLGVAFGSDIQLVKRLLQYIAETHPEVLNKPLPFVRFADFGPSSLVFTLYFFATIDKAWDVESALRFEIDQIFREYGIKIAFQQHDLHLQSAAGLEELFQRSKLKEQEAAEPESS